MSEEFKWLSDMRPAYLGPNRMVKIKGMKHLTRRKRKNIENQLNRVLNSKESQEKCAKAFVDMLVNGHAEIPYYNSNISE